MEYIVEDKDKEMVQTIKAHTTAATAALREKVVKAIIVSVQTGYAHPARTSRFHHQIVKRCYLQAFICLNACKYG